MKRKRVNVDDLVVGRLYYTECGIWRGLTTFVGSFRVGKRIMYRFTYGEAENWENQFGLFSAKSNIKVFEVA